MRASSLALRLEARQHIIHKPVRGFLCSQHESCEAYPFPAMIHHRWYGIDAGFSEVSPNPMTALEKATGSTLTVAELAPPVLPKASGSFVGLTHKVLAKYNIEHELHRFAVWCIEQVAPNDRNLLSLVKVKKLWLNGELSDKAFESFHNAVVPDIDGHEKVTPGLGITITGAEAMAVAYACRSRYWDLTRYFEEYHKRYTNRWKTDRVPSQSRKLRSILEESYGSQFFNL